MLSGDDINSQIKKWSTFFSYRPDKEDLAKQIYEKMKKKVKFSLQELVLKRDKIVAMRGIAGIGKTSIIEMYTLKWAKGKLCDQLGIDFIFSLTCREINNYLDQISSIEELFKMKYPEVFNTISFESLQPISHRILIIIDGVDELHNVYDMKTWKPQHQEWLSNLLGINSDFLPNHKILYSGRPKACNFIKQNFFISSMTKHVMVHGFNSNNIMAYIDHFFARDDTGMAENVKEAIRMSTSLSAMAPVPVFLWLICNLYSGTLVTKDLGSKTELYFHVCLKFIHNHLQRESKTQITATSLELVNNKDVIECFYCLMELATKTYFDDHVLFEGDEVKTLPKELHFEFVTKYYRDSFNSPMFQFSHLVLQEFLSSLYLYVTKDPQKPYSTKMEDCFPTFIGISKMAQTKDNGLFSQFHDNIVQFHHSYNQIPLPNPFHDFIPYKVIVPGFMLNENGFYINGNDDRCKRFLSLCYEVKFHVIQPITQCAEIRSGDLHDKRNISFFLDHLDIKKLIISDYYTLSSEYCEYIKDREVIFDLNDKTWYTGWFSAAGRTIKNYEALATKTTSQTRFVQDVAAVELSHRFEATNDEVANIITIEAKDLLTFKLGLDSGYVNLTNALGKNQCIVILGSFESEQVPCLVAILQRLKIEKVKIRKVDGQPSHLDKIIDITSFFDEDYSDELLELLLTDGELEVKSCFVGSICDEFLAIEFVRDNLVRENEH